MKNNSKLHPAQRAYLIAKANQQTAHEAENAADHAWLVAHDIRNPDGSVPKMSWMLEGSDEDIDRIFAEMGKDETLNRLWDESQNANHLLREAENALIDWALSVPGLPTKERETLRQNLHRLPIREKLIDLAIKLDASTSPTR